MPCSRAGPGGQDLPPQRTATQPQRAAQPQPMPPTHPQPPRRPQATPLAPPPPTTTPRLPPATTTPRLPPATACHNSTVCSAMEPLQDCVVNRVVSFCACHHETSSFVRLSTDSSISSSSAVFDVDPAEWLHWHAPPSLRP